MTHVLKESLVVCGICLLMAGTAAGQSRNLGSVTAQIEVQLEIIGSLSVIAEKGIPFGNVRAGQGPVSIAPDEQRAGMFIVEGRQGAPLTVNFTAPQGLDHAGGLGTMNVNTQLWGNDVNSANSADVVQLGETVNLGEDGRYYFFLQAALDVMEDERNPPGDYTGTFTLEVEYQ